MKLTRAAAAAYLSGLDRVLILAHRRPDGDTLGSAAALCRGLRQLGKTAYVLENPEVTEKYRFLTEGLTKKAAGEEDTVISVDIAALSLLTDNAAALADRIALRIDHHFSAHSFTPMELVDHEAAACGDIIFDILERMGVKPEPQIAEALYTAVSTDTGCFRFSNTNAHCYAVAAACSAAGGDLYTINRKIFDTFSLAKLRLQSYLTEHICLFHGGKMAICLLPRAVEQELGVNENDMDSISGFPQSVEGVEVSALLRQNPDGRIKLSMRAIPGFDVAAVCARLGGGGHKAAAGATLDMTMEQAAAAVRQEMEQLTEEA